jgi:imidazolonepropionase-like amidohydrolase
MRARAVLALLFAAGAALGAEAPATGVYSIVGATIHTVSGPDIAGGTIVVRGGKIASISAGSVPDAGGPVVDGAGKHVYPSLLPPMTVLGLEEIGAVPSTVDKEELGSINPDARADVAVNFDSELLPVARSGGILLAGVSPTGGIVSGSAAAMKMYGWTREDATLRAPAAIAAVWPDLSIDRSPSRSVRHEASATKRSRSSRARSATRGPTRSRARPRA